MSPQLHTLLKLSVIIFPWQNKPKRVVYINFWLTPNMLPPHHLESGFIQVTNDLHAIKFKEFFQLLSSLTSLWHLTLLIASSLLRYFSLFSLFFSYLSENASLVSFGSSLSSNWLLNVGVPQICIIFFPYTLSPGNLIHDYGMYPIFISLLRWLKCNSSSTHPKPNLGSLPWDLS